jgi:cytochrome P450
VAQNALPLFIGGMETFPKHFGSLLHWLHAFPPQRAKVVADPALAANAVEEAMRFDAPAPMLGRRVVKPVEWHGHTFQPGQPVMFLFQAANRDERVFERPDEFDVERTIKQQIAFGTGIHVCLGMHVARMESCMMLEWLLSQAPDYTVDGAERGLLAGMHGFRRLAIRIKP